MCIEFRPAAPDTGIAFIRRDLPGAPRVAARVEHRVDVPRRTNLVSGDATVDMVEHVMAALAGLQIDNCEVWCDAAEMPGPDGSSQQFVDALTSAGIAEQDAPCQQLAVTEPTRIEADGAWVAATPHDGLWLEYQLDFGNGPIGRQHFELELTPDSFRQELASARTFILAEEAECLRGQGCGLRTTHIDLLVFDATGPRDNPLRFDNECVRHKTLDMVGDLALANCDLVGKFTASRSGHLLNAQLLTQLLASQPAAAD